MRPAALSPSPYSAFPASSSAVGKPVRSMDAARLTDSVEGRAAFGTAGIPGMVPPSVQATSAGTISVAICPGAVRAATMALAASQPISDAEDDVRNHFE